MGHDALLWTVGLCVLALVQLVLIAWLLLRQSDKYHVDRAIGQVRQELMQHTERANERLERELRQQIGEEARENRNETMDDLARLQSALVLQMQGVQTSVGDLQAHMGETLAQRLDKIRDTLDDQLRHLQNSNAAKLDEMRQTVDEKLQSTLQQRLGESFKQVAERLDVVHRGLGEMQTLAQGVGDLKHLLSNVKTRGMFGEAQLGALLEQVFAPDQYASQVEIHPNSRHAVDFAVRLPGKSLDGTPVWLPIDAKFPTEDYERLLQAQQQANSAAAELAARQLELRIRQEAKSIAQRYIAPPHTTDFAILFLPTEGLYAEVLRRSGLMESLQREHHIVLAGPTTLLAMLNSLQMGFKTLALEQRSSEVWQVLGAVKTEFNKFGSTLDKVKKQTQTVLNSLEQAQVRNRAMHRALQGAESLPTDDAQSLLGLEPEDGTESSS